MRYIVCVNDIYSYEAPPGNVLWDSTHYCPASALTNEEAEQFWVYPLVEVPAPEYDPVTQSLAEGTPLLVDNTDWVQQWVVTDYPPDQAAANLETLKVDSRKQIDTDSGECYTTALNGLGSEYAMAEADASEYVNGGYLPPVPQSVQSLADARGVPPEQAADEILTGAEQWRVLQNDVRANRLAYKAEINADTTYAEIQDTMARWSEYVVSTSNSAVFTDL